MFIGVKEENEITADSLIGKNLRLIRGRCPDSSSGQRTITFFNGELKMKKTQKLERPKTEEDWMKLLLQTFGPETINSVLDAYSKLEEEGRFIVTGPNGSLYFRGSQIDAMTYWVDLSEEGSKVQEINYDVKLDTVTKLAKIPENWTIVKTIIE